MPIWPIGGSLAEGISLVVTPAEPKEVTATGETPPAIDAHIPIVVPDELLYETLAAARGSTVIDEPVGPHRAGGVVGVVELDQVIGDEQHGHPDLAQRFGEECPAPGRPVAVGAEAGVGPVERHQQIEVVPVEGI